MIELIKYRETPEGTELLILVPKLRLGEMLRRKLVKFAELRFDDGRHKKICLCRLHHTIAHQKGVEDFRRTYKVYGIIFQEEEDEQQTERSRGRTRACQ